MNLIEEEEITQRSKRTKTIMTVIIVLIVILLIISAILLYLINKVQKETLKLSIDNKSTSFADDLFVIENGNLANSIMAENTIIDMLSLIMQNKGLQLSKYQKEVMDDYTQYICLDRAGHYYIFRETSPMQYTVILDTYTIDLPELVEQYNYSTDKQKVQFNIQKFFDAINDGDYRYAYNKLDETYKNNNFPTQADFENYMKTSFYSKNTLGYTAYEKNGDLYIYRMVITNGEDSSQTIEKQFVVKLLEVTDFVMSFEK